MSIENSCVRLDEGRWNPKNREVLEKLIEKYRNTNSYAVFDWDNTSIQGDTQQNLFIYQIENLKYKLNLSSKSVVGTFFLITSLNFSGLNLYFKFSI